MENETIVFIELDSSVFYLENCLTSLRVTNTFVVYSRVLSFILFFVFAVECLCWAHCFWFSSFRNVFQFLYFHFSHNQIKNVHHINQEKSKSLSRSQTGFISSSSSSSLCSESWEFLNLLLRQKKIKANGIVEFRIYWGLI